MNPDFHVPGFVEMLRALEGNEREKGDKIRAASYNKAANAFRDYNGPAFQNGKEAQKVLKGVGQKIAAKFNEFLEQGSLSRVERDRSDPRARALSAQVECRNLAAAPHTPMIG